jgi:hypothetical protein
VGEALDLIHEVAPRRLVRIQRSFRGILVGDLTGSAWWATSRTCFIESRTLLKRSAADTASVIVHEATHARLMEAGIWTWPALRNRIECCCLRQEIAFVDRLPRDRFPSADSYIDYLRGTIALFESGRYVRRREPLRWRPSVKGPSDDER